jgi:hypothetical protein
MMKNKTNTKLPGSRNEYVSLNDLVVRPIKSNEEERWNQLMSKHHYLGFNSLVGNSLKYVAILNERWVALLGWGAAALSNKCRDQWIGWAEEQKYQRLKYIANNMRFLILPDIHIKNLASKTLALNLKRLSNDWQDVYNHPIVLAETFVEDGRFEGTCYKAANWVALGKTRGYGKTGKNYYYHGNIKTILVYPLRKNARKLLSAEFLSPELTGGRKTLMDLNNFSIAGDNGLLEHLSQIKDPRKKRGIRHKLISVLAISICAAIAGARNYTAIAEWAADLTQEQLKLFKCRRKRIGKKTVYIPPSEPTIRRTLKSVNADEVDIIVGNWLYAQYKKQKSNQDEKEAIAIDGKTLRGSGTKDKKAVHLVSALVHNEKVVISQYEVDEKSNEITAFKPLIDNLDIEGKVITADAIYAQREHARYLKEEKNADYIFQIKGNQKTILEDIEAVDDSDFSP